MSAEMKTKSERTRGRLVAGTLDEICATGTFSAESVAARTGTSVASFYGHLVSKDEALTEAFSSALRALVEIARDCWNVERMLKLGLLPLCETGVQECVSFFREHTLVFRLGLAEHPNSASLRRVYREHEQQVLDGFVEFVRLGQRARMIRGDEGDVTAIALSHLVLTQGLNNPHLLATRNEQLETSVAAAIYANLARTYEPPFPT